LTDGEGFAEWFDGRNTLAGSSLLRKATRLVKYQRDIKQTFSAKSVLLATLLGTMIYDGLLAFQVRGSPASMHPRTARPDGELE
jgi:hypothetical protein